MPGRNSRTDSTAWGIVALQAYHQNPQACERGMSYLVTQQQQNGQINIAPDVPDASWPTALAIFGWHRSSRYSQAEKDAAEFLLHFSGYHWPKTADALLGHDPSIPGWPWIANTHSWVIPTGLAILALEVMGLGTHARVKEGKAMILNRQLSHGGWNYGNTLVFGKELYPLPECTGVALQALAKDQENRAVERSLEYLLKKLPALRTPISLGWALLGLGAWGLKPTNTRELVLRSLTLQKRYGPYPLTSLALLLCAAQAPQGLLSLFTDAPELAETPMPSHATLARQA